MNELDCNCSYTFRPSCRAIFRLIFEQVECTIDNVNWKLYQLYEYIPSVQRSAWRWPYNWTETCSWNYNL